MLQTVRYIRREKPCIGIRQEVVNGIALGDGPVGLDGVDVVVSRSYTQLGFEKTGCNELQAGRNNKLAGLRSDEKATLIRPGSDLNNGGFKRSLVKVSSY